MSRLTTKFHDLSVRWKLLGAFGLVMLMVIAQSAFVYRSTVESHSASGLVEHTLQVIDRIDNTSNALVDMQTGYRGFLLTGDETYLAPYVAGRVTFQSELRVLNELTDDSSEQLARWSDLERRAAVWQREITEPGIALRRQVDGAGASLEAVQTFARTAGGKAQFDAMRQVLVDAESAENQLLTRRAGDAGTARNHLRQVVVLGTVVICLLAVLLAVSASLGISQSMSRLSETAEKIAAGDLSRRVNLGNNDEIGRTGHAFDRMVERLQAVVRQLEISVGRAQTSEARARAVLDGAGEGMALVSSEGQVLAANRRFAEVFRADLDQIIGRSAGELRTLLERIFAEPGILERLLKSNDDGGERSSEIIHQRWPVEREFEVVTSAVVSQSGERTSHLLSFRDVTQQREVDRMKSDFVSLVSHELRTPLTSIKGYVDLLIEGEVGDLAPDQLEFLGIVRSNADRLVSLINDLLDISRIEGGKVVLTTAPVELDRLVQGLVLSFRPQVESKQQTLVVDLPSGLPDVEADVDRLTQVVANLLSNAHKYTPVGGEITVRAQCDGNSVKVEIADTGIGMTEQEQAQLFTKFFRASNRTTQEVGGTGLGLVITRSLVNLHGSDLVVSSTPGEGSTFSFSLRVSSDAARSLEDPDAVHRRGHVLVVEDDADIGALIQRYLGRAGHRVTLATTGSEAIAAARQRHPDVITLDLVLPDMDGIDVLSTLKGDPATLHIPVVLLSVHADDGEGARRGAGAFLTKPVEEGSLLSRVEEMLAVGAEPAGAMLGSGSWSDRRPAHLGTERND